MKDLVRKAEVMGVAAHLTREPDGTIRIALPAFAVGKKTGEAYYWAGALKDGRVVCCWFEPAKAYLEQIAKLPETSLPTESWE